MILPLDAAFIMAPPWFANGATFFNRAVRRTAGVFFMLFQRVVYPVFLAAALCAGAVQAQTAAAPMAAAPVAAPVVAEGAWARASVTGQKATGAFMRLTASTATRLVSASSAVAGVTELHEMKMEGDVMKMRAIAGLDLPAGKAVELKPGSYHVMLMDLKAPLVAGTQVALTLVFQDAQGAKSELALQVPVSAKMPGQMPAGAHGMKQH